MNFLRRIFSLRLFLFIILSCYVPAKAFSLPPDTLTISKNGLSLSIDPADWSLTMLANGKKIPVSAALKNKQAVSNLQSSGDACSWYHPQSGLSVAVRIENEYIDIHFTAKDSQNITWPVIGSDIDAITIPFYQGKYIPAKDPVWLQYLAGKTFSGLQDLSMQFFAVNYPDTALLYIITNPYNNELEFSDHQKTLGLSFHHEFPITVKKKEFGFRVLLMPNNPTSIAKKYLSYIKETSRIVTLEEKAMQIPGVRKLYGAPHMYVWNTEGITVADVNKWKLLKDHIAAQQKLPGDNPVKHLLKLFKNGESGREFLNQLAAFSKDEYVIKYHKSLLCKALSEVLLRNDVYNPQLWKNLITDEKIISLSKKNNPAPEELYALNEYLLYTAFPDMLKPLAGWGGASPGMIDEMKASGIGNAWIGLNDWTSAQLHPAFAQRALDSGYLLGPYDSYHSMHEPGKERWLTAKFTDTTLYYKACVLNKAGKPIGGFLGQGRKLNPVLSMPAVEERLNSIIDHRKPLFNSWFIDCDGTGEIYDDYTPGRMTSQQQDLEARLKRMSWIRDQYHFVIGTEVGNDFAAQVIAFGHGMTTPVIAWEDPDMRHNKKSPWFIGSYFSQLGGIPERYSLQVPIKEKYHHIYYDNRFNLPLFQLVYNNSVITSHHWEWNSLKVPAERVNNSLKEILYNVPPLYHLDNEEWKKLKDIIIKHVKVFSRTHAKAVNLEMTDFEWLSDDHLVQLTRFENKLEIIANFGTRPFSWKEKTVPALGLLIHDLSTGVYEVYQP